MALNLEYMGTCISTVDDSCIWDATEMAQVIEASEDFNLRIVMQFVNQPLKNEIELNINNFESGINKTNNIIWIYDIDSDIHYFYKITMTDNPHVQQIRDNLPTADLKIVNDLLDKGHWVLSIQHIYNNVLKRKGLKEAKEVIDLIRSERSALKRT
jgi:hypothetical protein